MTSNIVYRHIENSRRFTSDEFWSFLIHNCACNKFPKWVKYDHSKSVLHVKNPSGSGGKSVPKSFPLPSDPKGCYDTLMHIFKVVLKIRSEQDIKNSKQKIEESRKEGAVDTTTEWVDLRPRSVRAHMLMSFATEEVKRYDLPIKKTNILYKLIQLGFQFKNLTPSDVKYKNGVVLSINGLEYNENTKFFELTKEREMVSRSSEQISPKYNILKKSVDKWAKDYANNLVK